MASVLVMDSNNDLTRLPSSSFASMNAEQTKRARAGSISGRLRAASDLADFGWINSNEKGLVKDLIIADDPDVNAAIEKYQTDGDTQALSAVVKNPQKRRLSIDLVDTLGDLDWFEINDGGDYDDFTNANTQNNMSISGATFKSRSNSLSMPDFDFTNGSIIPKTGLGNNNNSSSSSIDNKKSLKDSFGNIGFGNNNFGSKASQRRGSVSWADVPDQWGGIDLNVPLEPSIGSSSFFESGGDDDDDQLVLTDSTNAIINQHLFLPTSQQQSYQHHTYGSNNNNYYIKSNSPSSRSSNQYITTPYHNVHLHSTGDTPHGTPTFHTGEGYIGAYSPEERKKRIARFIEKRNRRVWSKRVKYDVRKNFADSRIRVKGRFVKKEDEDKLRAGKL